MDMYIKQLLTEISQKAKTIDSKANELLAATKKIFSDVTGHASEYERYYTLIKTADDEKVSPGHLPFSVYSRPEEPAQNSKKDDGEESERISNMMQDKKRVFERTLQQMKTKAMLFEQGIEEYIEMIKDLHDYYEDLIEGLKF